MHLNEVLTDSFQRRRMKARPGRLSVQLFTTEKPPACNLIIRGDGTGTAGSDPPSPPAFGLLLIKILAQQIKGSYEYTYNEETLFQLKFPTVRRGKNKNKR
jgi:two-component sensor histidine kinase